MSSLGWTVEEDIFSDHTPYGAVTFSNVIATFDPSKAKRIAIACHYDSKYMPGKRMCLVVIFSYESVI